MTQSHFDRTAALALAALISTSTFGATAQAQSATLANPPFVNVTPLNSQPFSLAAQRGKWVVVVTWASWCPPCIEALPVVANYVKAHPDVTAVGLDVHESRSGDAARFLSRHALNFPMVALAPSADKKFVTEIPGIPDVWVIAPDGAVVQSRVGGFTPAQLAELMHKAGYPGASKH